MFGRRKVATLVAEFLGTGILTLLVLSVQRSTIGVPFFVAAAAGLTFALLIYALGGISGGYFNPAITIGMWTARRISTIAGALYVVVQLLGAWAAYGIYTYFANNGLQSVGGHYTTRILIAESIGTAIFAFGYAAAVYQRFSVAATASYAGLAYMIGIIAASSAAIGLLNPALALGIRAWVWGTYVLGPVIGAVIGINLYDLLFSAEGESANLLTLSGRSTRPVASATATRPAAKKSSRRKK